MTQKTAFLHYNACTQHNGNRSMPVQERPRFQCWDH